MPVSGRGQETVSLRTEDHVDAWSDFGAIAFPYVLPAMDRERLCSSSARSASSLPRHAFSPMTAAASISLKPASGRCSSTNASGATHPRSASSREA